MLAASHRCRARELAKLGVRLTVVLPEKWEYQRFESGSEEGYEVRVSPIALAWSKLGSLAHHTFYYREISRIICREPWDLVHIDEEPFNFACYHAAKLCSRNGLKWIFFSWQNILKRYPPPFSMFEKSAFENANAAIAGSSAVEMVLRQRGFAKPVKVISQFGVNPDVSRSMDRFHVRRKLGLEGFTVGYIGRMVREKGLDTLVRAFAQLPDEAKLVLVGSGPFEPVLKQMVSSLGIFERTRCVPWTNSQGISEYMNALDTLVLPSRTVRSWKEQFGRVLVEAMACGTCVVGSDSGEIPNVIGDAGLVFHEGDEQELARHLARLMKDPSLRDRLGRHGQARVMDRFAYSKIARDTLAVYDLVCASASDLALVPGCAD